MTDRFRKRERPQEEASSSGRSARLPRWKVLLFSLLPAVVLFVLLEVALALAGIEPRTRREDPFVGYVSTLPLFVETVDQDGTRLLATATNKSSFFNRQSFPATKADGTYRIFCLGGSTTYGRPYSDPTSFAGWLRELLPVADRSRRWEVINAGGISYASYRIARLMDELVRYKPDLFIIYTGHNEFLEDRTYGRLRSIPGPVRSLMAIAARTRTWAAAGALLARRPDQETPGRDRRSLLPSEVQARLDRSAGPAVYERDDALRNDIIEHFRFSLRHMVETAQATGARVVLVKPASNLKNCAPFKSQHVDGLSARDREEVERRLGAARDAAETAVWPEVLASLERAEDLDPRHAEVSYLKGRALLAQGRMDEAEEALVRARDEDVCPLRALSEIQEIVGDVAAATGAVLVDFVDLTAGESAARAASRLPGEELFLDHVHPTIEGHRLLAVALVDALAREEIVRPGEGWGETAVAAVTEKVEELIDPEAHALALANLSLTLDWAGKKEESRRLAFRALESGAEHPTILMMVARHEAMAGDGDAALTYLRRAVKASPGDPVVHSQTGLLLAGRRELEAAAAHFFLASLIWADNDVYHQQLGFALGERHRPELALASLLEARRLNPANASIESRINALRAGRPAGSPEPAPRKLVVTRYPSGYPHTLAQTTPGPDGQPVIDGIWTEWFDGGGLKAFADHVAGGRHGVSVIWNEDGDVIERQSYRDGRPVPDDSTSAASPVSSGTDGSPSFSVRGSTPAAGVP